MTRLIGQKQYIDKNGQDVPAIRIFYDDNQYINRNRDPDLRFYRALSRTVKCLDTQVLFDPFEKEFHLSAAAVKIRNGQRWQGEIVGQKNQSPLLLIIVEPDPAKFFKMSSTFTSWTLLSVISTNVGMLPLRSSRVCNLTATLVLRSLAHGCQAVSDPGE